MLTAKAQFQTLSLRDGKQRRTVVWFMAMNLPICHREERSDVAIQLESWIAAVGFASFAMTNRFICRLGDESSMSLTYDSAHGVF